VTLASGPCDCGRTLRRIEGIEGRTEDVIWLPGADGRRVAVVPMQFSVVARDRDVVEFQIVQEGARLVVRVVARGAAPGLEERLRAGLADRLRSLGAPGVEIDVRREGALTRSAGGKLALVVADRRALAAA
jgi:phenylacetate-coenzyme A ligase PaaK-like adenylate-forming protein